MARPQDEVLGEGEDLLSLVLPCSLKAVPADREVCVLGCGLGHLTGELHRVPLCLGEDLGPHGNQEGVRDHWAQGKKHREKLVRGKSIYWPLWASCLWSLQ